MATVADIMTREVLTIDSDAHVGQTASELLLSGVHGAPVRDPSGQVVGVLSTTDLVDPDRPGANEDALVKDAMSPVIFAVRTGDHVMDAAQRMLDTGTHRLLVFDDDGHVAGILSATDFLRALTRGVNLLRSAEQQPYEPA
jgi:predicted transcriptional regulator